MKEKPNIPSNQLTLHVLQLPLDHHLKQVQPCHGLHLHTTAIGSCKHKTSCKEQLWKFQIEDMHVIVKIDIPESEADCHDQCHFLLFEVLQL